MDLLIIYLLIINAAGWLLMLIDKEKARRNAWRIPERVLFGVGLCGGSLGCFMGMRMFRHKTKHLKFSLGLPVMVCAHILILLFLHFYFR
jgi:uncharacterized membrane protein YsdA (DUF1294 family)